MRKKAYFCWRFYFCGILKTTEEKAQDPDPESSCTCTDPNPYQNVMVPQVLAHNLLPLSKEISTQKSQNLNLY
jgi:hypothetical protein